MINKIKIMLIMIVLLVLSSCITSQEDVNKAKQDLGIIEQKVDSSNLTEEKLEDEIVLENKDDKTKNEEILVEKNKVKKIEIKYLTEEKFIELNDLSNENIFDGEVEITGNTTTLVEKIVVTFNNESSNFPRDIYTLKKFKSGDDNFLYRAFTKYETLDKGKNTYLIEAYSEDKVSKLELTINVIKEKEVINDIIKNNIEDIPLSYFPANEIIGNPVNLGNGKVSYTDLKGLEIEKYINLDLTCENLTNVLTDKINTWFFWNTCRPIEKDGGISFFVITLKNGEYSYDKHYYISNKGLYGIQELEKGFLTNNENIEKKNFELKEKNKDYTILNIVDELFLEISK